MKVQIIIDVSVTQTHQDVEINDKYLNGVIKDYLHSYIKTAINGDAAGICFEMGKLTVKTIRNEK